MSEDVTVTGAVAKVVSDREVILNRGQKDGLSEGVYVAVMDPTTQSIMDPDSGEELGGFTRIKAVLLVVETTERLSLAKTFRTRRVQVSGGQGMVTGFTDFFAEPKYETRIETLKHNPAEGLPINEKDSVISIADPFITVSEEEAEDKRTATLWR